MRHAEDVGAGFRVPQLGGAGEPVDRLELAGAHPLGGLLHGLGELLGARLHGEPAAAHGQGVAHAGAELHGVQRAGEEGGRAHLERGVAELPLVVGGDHEDGELLGAVAAAELGDHVEPGEAGHQVVDDHEVGRGELRSAQRLRRVGEQHRLAPGNACEESFDQPQVEVGVVDDRDAHGGWGQGYHDGRRGGNADRGPP